MWRRRTITTSRAPHALSRVSPRPATWLALALGLEGHDPTPERSNPAHVRRAQTRVNRKMSRRVSRVGQGRFLSWPDFDPGWSGARTRSCRSKPRSKIRPVRCRTRRRASAADLWHREVGSRSRKGRRSGRARSGNVGAHQREVFRARVQFSALTMSGRRAHQLACLWRLVDGCGKVKDDCGKLQAPCGGFRLVLPDPAKTSVRLFHCHGRAREPTCCRAVAVGSSSATKQA